MNYQSANSASSGDNETNSFHQLQQASTAQQHQSNQGRLLFKRQDKNAGLTSQALQQRNHRNTLNHYEESKGAGAAGLFEASNSGNGSGGARQNKANTQKVYLGDKNKRETALRSSQNQPVYQAAMASPRSEDPRNGALQQPKGQSHLRNSYESMEELKHTPIGASVNNH